MELREKIAERITQSRKAVGITIKELAARTKELSPARISNWEQGTRSPGPIEAKLLAEQLHVSASYLLCLTDHPAGELSFPNGKGPRFTPVLPMQTVNEYESLLQQPAEREIVIDDFNQSKNSTALFACVMDDNSMQPDFNVGDVIVIDAELAPKPGDFVLAYLPAKQQVILRKYRESADCLFQLLASNELWAGVHVKDLGEVELIGVLVEKRTYSW